MDRSLDEIIGERPQKQNQPRRGRGNRNTGNAPRDGVKKSYRERVDLDRDWVHDKFEDNTDSRSYRRDNRPRRDRFSPESEQQAKLRVDNLHYDLTEEDLEGLFSKIGPVSRVRIQYDRAGRSEGAAIITYNHIDDARSAIKEFDGANAKGQPIRLTLLPPGGGIRGGRNPFDHVERPKRSLFERIERPHDRSERSLSPESDNENATGGRRRRGRGGQASRRSDVTKPAPDHIDRYVPGQRSPTRRTGGGGGGGRRPGERRDEKRRDGQGRQTANGRPKKTQEELDQEMEDYWGTANAGTAGTGSAADASAADQTAPAPAAATGPPLADDDIDMIE